MKMDLKEAQGIVQSFKEEKGALLSLLEDINSHYGYLSPEVLRLISKELGYPLSQLYSIATFYNVFHLEPRGRHSLRVCQGTACYVRGGRHILETIERDLKITDGQTTPDGQFSLETVRCMGCCSLAPVIQIDDKIFARLKLKEIGKILESYR